jgi:hypothetical protein
VLKNTAPQEQRAISMPLEVVHRNVLNHCSINGAIDVRNVSKNDVPDDRPTAGFHLAWNIAPIKYTVRNVKIAESPT